MYGKINICWLLGLFCTLSLWANDKDYLLPKPQQVFFYSNSFRIDKVKLVSSVLREELETFVIEQGGIIESTASSSIVVTLCDSLFQVPVHSDEAYRLKVGVKRIDIEATASRGVYMALQTLRQLVAYVSGRVVIRGCEILDWPAFPIRGFMHDVGRSYLSLEELKREIAILSRFKINTFHWHLTENQAWRLESKIFPMLNDSSNMTRMKGKYYKLEEARELVDFCKKHHVLLIPEIDMPGHSDAFRRTFRHDMQSREGKQILKLLLDEICETFDVPYLHIGTDEVKFKDKDFVPEMVSYVRSKGKKVISWNPGWQYGLGEIDMLQLWGSRGKAPEGVPFIDSRFHYLNHYDTFGDIVALYNSRVGTAGRGDNVAGVMMCVWNDRLLENEMDILLENNFYPNMLAVAERSWRGGGSEYFNGRGIMLPIDKQSDIFLDFEDFERRMLWHKKNTFTGFPFAYVKQTNVQWKITDAFPNEGDLKQVFPPEKELKETYIYEGKSYKTYDAIGAGIYLRHVWGKIVPAFYQDPQENHTAYAYTYVYSPKKQEVGLWAEFQNYSRSEMDLPPLQGTWDYKGSRIWINDKEILPPTWTATHRVKDNEIPLGNENFVSRPPILVGLNKGWNKVLLKLPIGKFSSNEVRLIKWMFTVVFVTPDGTDAVEGLVYAPEKLKQ